jgi:hypothetical protein
MKDAGMDTPAADFDGAWKFALETYLPECLALFFPAAYNGIDWQQPVRFRSTELQQLAPDDQAGVQRVDALVEVTQRDGSPALVLVHLEVQSQRDAAFPERMFRYNTRLFDRHRVPIVSLAILGDESPQWHPTRFGYGQWGCDIELRFPTVKLLALDVGMLAATPNPIATLTLMHRDAHDTRGDAHTRLRRKSARFRTMLQQGYTAEDVRRLIRLMEHVLRLPEALRETARDALRQVETEERGMTTFVTSFEELGRAEGQRALILRMLNRKVGPVPEAVQQQVAQLDSAALLDLSDALLDFTTLADLTEWLAQRQARVAAHDIEPNGV